MNAAASQTKNTSWLDSLLTIIVIILALSLCDLTAWFMVKIPIYGEFVKLIWTNPDIGLLTIFAFAIIVACLKGKNSSTG